MTFIDGGWREGDSLVGSSLKGAVTVAKQDIGAPTANDEVEFAIVIEVADVYGEGIWDRSGLMKAGLARCPVPSPGKTSILPGVYGGLL